ncbi:uncharacterized protein [Spinacia oleracea]|uniref:Uncharacterized protein isoform X2 n=1 Tax=Spinacia oleracea TaxID=3562 RepID=A0ABM3QNI8_SPIOL|nr:uncharacterized protein LOC110784597 isoform X2 [Spinacia oleracea]
MAMTVQLQQQAATTAATASKSWSIPSALVPPAGTSIGLRRAADRFALRSSFSSSSLRLPSVNVTAAPKFSMRVASKQAYICRDCGYIYNDPRKPFEKLPDNFFCAGKLCLLPLLLESPYSVVFTSTSTAPSKVSDRSFVLSTAYS